MRGMGGVRPLAQFMEDGSFLMPEVPAVLRALQAMGAPEWLDYDYAMSVSGAALRLTWQMGWAGYEGLPNQAEVFFNGRPHGLIETALTNLGAAWRYRDMAGLEALEAEREIRAALDQKRPVILFQQDVCVTVLGYDDEALYVVGTLLNPEERVEPYGYNRLTRWKETAEGYFLIDGFAPKPTDRARLIQVMAGACRLARTRRTEGLDHAALGLAAFEAVADLMVWDEGFEGLSVSEPWTGELSFPLERPAGYYRADGGRTLSQRFWQGYCDFLCMLNGYENFYRFLVKYAGLIPEWSEAILRAAGDYRVACESSGLLWDYVTPDEAGVEKFKEKPVRYAFAAHMLRARLYTLRGVEIFEGLLNSPLGQARY